MKPIEPLRPRLSVEEGSRSRRKHFVGLVMLPALLLVNACSSRYSTQDAYARCDELLDRVAGSDAGSFDDCVACHEDCGDKCRPRDGAYRCPD